MKFIMTAGWDDGIAHLTERLVRELGAGKQVLWLVCGGSNIPSVVQVMDNISDSLTKNLIISLSDERYGEPGHADSNWKQLKEAGFNPKQARTWPILTESMSFEQAIKHYDELAASVFEEADLTIAQLGIGTDGHIAGILPGSAAALEGKALAAGFEAPPLKRMTLTFPGLKKIDIVYAFAFGEPKREALESLKNSDQPLVEQPSQILKQLPEAYLYNDQVGD